jgi:hypothetical protein
MPARPARASPPRGSADRERSDSRAGLARANGLSEPLLVGDKQLRSRGPTGHSLWGLRPCRKAARSRLLRRCRSAFTRRWGVAWGQGTDPCR